LCSGILEKMFFLVQGGYVNLNDVMPSVICNICNRLPGGGFEFHHDDHSIEGAVLSLKVGRESFMVDCALYIS
jgi:hypothetical protein